jgi:hypothetical protein
MDCYCFCKSAVFVSIVLLSIVFAVNGITEECTFKDPVSSFIKSSDSKDASSCRNEETLDKDFNINSIRNDWNGPLTSLSCKLRWFSAAETCDLFEKNNGLLILHGDSTVRHIAQALLMILSDNMYSGGLNIEDINQLKNSEEIMKECTCLGQFDDHKVRFEGSTNVNGGKTRLHKCYKNSLALNTMNLARYNSPQTSSDNNTNVNSKYCSKWLFNRIIYRECYKVDEPGLTRTKCKQSTSDILSQFNGQVSLFASGGLHSNMPTLGPHKEDIHLAMADLAKQYSINETVKANGGFAKSIIGTIPHCQTEQKVEKYRRVQCGNTLENFNNELRQFAIKKSLHLFDTEHFTRNQTSIDGVHYGLQTMIPMAQYLLNYLVALNGWEV